MDSQHYIQKIGEVYPFRLLCGVLQRLNYREDLKAYLEADPDSNSLKSYCVSTVTAERFEVVPAKEVQYFRSARSLWPLVISVADEVDLQRVMDLDHLHAAILWIRYSDFFGACRRFLKNYLQNHDTLEQAEFLFLEVYVPEDGDYYHDREVTVFHNSVDFDLSWLGEKDDYSDLVTMLEDNNVHIQHHPDSFEHGDVIGTHRAYGELYNITNNEESSNDVELVVTPRQVREKLEDKAIIMDKERARKLAGEFDLPEHFFDYPEAVLENRHIKDKAETSSKKNS